jgi:hypothetical protein
MNRPPAEPGRPTPDTQAPDTQAAGYRWPWWVAPTGILFGLFAWFLFSFQRYRPYEIDNPWFLSFSYDTCIEHIDTDQFLNVHFPGGMDGTMIFGKLAAYLQCAVLSRTGWQQLPAALLSSALVTLGLGFWMLQLRRLGFSVRFLSCFLVTVGLSEPVIAVANKFRYEFLSFALLSLGLLLVAYSRPALGVFVAALAIEVQPFGLAGLIPVLVLASSECAANGKSAWRLPARFAVALALAAAVYLALHPHIVTILRNTLVPGASGERFDGGLFRAYFLNRPRHLPEALCFAVAGIVYWRRRRGIRSHYLAFSALALTLFSVAMPHGNPAYMIFLYPFLVGMTLIAFDADRRPWLLAACGVLFAVGQQLVLFHLTRNEGFRAEDIATVSNAIASSERQLAIPDDSLRIYGDYRLWYAHPHFYRSSAQSTAALAADADLYLCFDHAPQPEVLAPVAIFYCPTLNNLLPLRLLESLPVRNDRLYVYARK